jgi:hypothetical protein
MSAPTPAYRSAILLLYSGLIVDTATTAIAMKDDPNFEQNPIGAWLLSRIGVWGLLALFSGATGVAYWAYPRTRHQRLLFTAVTLAGIERWAVVGLNFRYFRRRSL